MIIVAAATLVATAYPTVPQYATTTNSSILTSTEVHPEIVIDYSYSTVSCLGTSSVSCFVLVSPYTATETRSAQIAETILSLSASTKYVPYASSGLAGVFAVVVMLFFLVVGLVLVARKH